jgi:hypothetical protein
MATTLGDVREITSLHPISSTKGKKRMLVLGHIGYTVGAAWALDSLTHRETQIDYRALALMAMTPDIIDRALFVFILPSALSGRLIAHTLLFQLAFFLAIILMRRSWWLYGAASALHLLLDTPGLSGAWARQVFWPFMGVELSAINILPGTGGIVASYTSWVWLRIQQAFQPYSATSWWPWLLELGGALTLIAFAYRKTLYRRAHLRRFVVSGKLQRQI